MSILRQRNGNCVVGVPPEPDDLFTVVLVAARVALVRTVSEYDETLRLAQELAAQISADGPGVTVKVLATSLDELLLLQGVSREDFAASMDGEEDDWRALVVEACRRVLVEGHDAGARREALALVEKIGGAV